MKRLLQVRVGSRIRRLQVVLPTQAAGRITVGIRNPANVSAILARVDRNSQSPASRPPS